jgi:hypothetical protein
MLLAVCLICMLALTAMSAGPRETVCVCDREREREREGGGCVCGEREVANARTRARALSLSPARSPRFLAASFASLSTEQPSLIGYAMGFARARAFQWAHGLLHIAK